VSESRAKAIDPVRLTVFDSRLSAICETMGASLRRAAFSPNIRDRLDYSCALFDAAGGLLAQATHIPVHLGSMAWAMKGLARGRDWSPGDGLILNDPYQGGTHLPDVTLIQPVFVDEQLLGFAASRAHHADIGVDVPGSMPLSTHLEQEGVLIPPQLLYRGGDLDRQVLDGITHRLRNPRLSDGDLRAQAAACRYGARALSEWAAWESVESFGKQVDALNDYGRQMAASLLKRLPSGEVEARDWMDDDGQGNEDICIQAQISLSDQGVEVDFQGTDEQVGGNVNCPLSVTAAAVYYVFRCLLPTETPNCAGSLESVSIRAPEGCLVNARYPGAVAAGNVETSQRIVDVLLKALAGLVPDRIPAASQGTMNNIAMGGDDWSYYETLAGGCGASRNNPGRSATHSHMTNTLNTPVEVLEKTYPLRVLRYEIRAGSGGQGVSGGGNGVIREYEFLDDTDLCLLTERRRRGPWSLAGGQPGQPGMQVLDGEELPPKVRLKVHPGQRLVVETPGGGGYGDPAGQDRDCP